MKKIKSIIVSLISVIATVCLSVALSACFSSAGNNDKKIIFSDFGKNVSIKFVSDRDCPSANIVEDKLSDSLDFKTNEMYYMVVDYSMTADEDGEREDYLYADINIYPLYNVKATLEETASSKFEEKVANGTKNISVKYSVPENKGQKKKVRIIVKVEFNEMEITHLSAAFYSKHDHVKFIGGKTFSAFGSYTEGLEYSILSDGVSVDGLGTSRDTDLVIPPFVYGRPVLEIGQQAFNCKAKYEEGQYGVTNIKSVKIPDTVTTIRESAFANCNKMEQVEVGNGVDVIEAGAFVECSNLKTVKLGDSVSIIGARAFDACSNLEDLSMPDSIKYIGSRAFGYAFSYKNYSYNVYDNGLYVGNGNNPYVALVSVTDTKKDTIKINENTKIIYDYALSGCGNLKKALIPESVIYIGSKVFNYCTNLEYSKALDGSLYVGSANNAYYALVKGTEFAQTCNVNSATKVICGSAFDGSNTQYVNMGTGVVAIGERAFSKCNSLKEVILNDKLTTVGDDAFSECKNLEKLSFGKGVEYIGEGACLNCSKLKSVVLPDSLTHIGGGAFSDCTALTEVKTGTGLKSIGYAAFSDCGSLESITIPSSLTSLADSAFAGCDSLKSVNIPEHITRINSATFTYCSELSSVVISENLMIVDYAVFNNCNKLKTVYYKGTEVEWTSIYVDPYDNLNNKLLSAKRYYYSETKPTKGGNYWHYVDGVPVVW